MGGRGPAPKPAHRRARRNSNPAGMTVLRFEEAPQPELPELPGGELWSQRTLEWWAMWSACPQAEHFGSTDWEFLLDTALIHHDVWGHLNLDRLPELRIRVAKFGATPEDRARLRMQFADADEKEARRAKSFDDSAAHRTYPQLKAVD